MSRINNDDDGAQPSNEDDNPSESQDDTMFLVPSEDLTRHNYETHHSSMTDKQIFSWAYKTETKIRFQKLESRGDGESTARSTTLSSEYLIDIYPATDKKNMDAKTETKDDALKLTLERDLLLFQRKATKSLSDFKPPDSTLTPIYTDGASDICYNSDDSSDVDDDSEIKDASDTDDASGKKPVPPNYLYFLICLECYTGYDVLGLCNSEDTSIPRSGIMGGAVVAALSSWSDPTIISMFKPLENILLSSLERGKKRERDGDEKKDNESFAGSYYIAKELLRKKLNNHFLSPEDQKDRRPAYIHYPKQPKVYQPRTMTRSAYEEGDVDFFLSASPLSKSLFNQHYDVISNPLVNEFLGGCGLCHDDLYRFSKRILQRLNANHEETGQFVHALTKNGLSFMFAPYHNKWIHEYSNNFENCQEEGEQILEMIWPRSTQLIMLDPQADLLGALLDFDLSVATCAFDGTTVRVAPRAALSLARKLVVVTPFCFEEKRNRKRILKYAERGFQPMILDPNCPQVTSLESLFSFDIEASEFPTIKELKAGGEWKSRRLRTEKDYDKIIELQKKGIRVRPGWRPTNPDLVYCCCLDGPVNNVHYSMALFESSQNDATEFFKNMFDWPEAKIREVNEVPPHSRIACGKCRQQYGLSQFLKEEHPIDEFEDMLHGPKSLMKSVGSHCGDLSPSFYGGPTFNSKLVRNDARSDFMAQSMLFSQSRAEMLRYMIRHNTLKGYKQRFTFTRRDPKCDLVNNPLGPLKDVFVEASKLTFPESGRSPVGLNPERFIAKCKACNDWLHGAEYRTVYCENCINLNTPQTTEASATYNESHNDDEFEADQNEVDDETTMIAEERLGRDMTYEEELAMLTWENEMSLEELRAMYAGMDDDN